MEERVAETVVERVRQMLITAPQQSSPIPPSSFSHYASERYGSVQAEHFPQIDSKVFDTSNKTEEVMNAEIWPLLKEGGVVEKDDIVVINTERYTWLPCTNEEVNDLKPDFAVVHRAFFVPGPGAGDLTGRVHKSFVDQVLAVNEGKTTPLNRESKGRLLRYLYHLRIAGMCDVKGLLYNGTYLHYVWMDGNNVVRVAESTWPANGTSPLRSWSVPYQYPPMTEALIQLCSRFGVKVHCGDVGAVLGKGGVWFSIQSEAAERRCVLVCT